MPVFLNTLSETKSIKFFISLNLALPLFIKKLQCFSEIHASQNVFLSGTDSLINCQTFLSD